MPRRPDPGGLAAILLGSDRFDLMPEKLSKAAFRNSTEAIRCYLTSKREGLGLTEDLVLDLFGSENPVERQDKILTDFLIEKGGQLDALLIYYVGHGGFLSDRQYFLAVKTTDLQRKHVTGFKIRDLAETLKLNAATKKIYLVLDCCFSGAAVNEFQVDDLSSFIENQTYESLPEFGTALLAASSRHEPALTPEGNTYTMLADTLLSVLHEGIPRRGRFLSMREVAERTAILLKGRYGSYAVRPEVHTPRQINGDIADLPLFPNHAAKVPRFELEYDSAKERDFYGSWRCVGSPAKKTGAGPGQVNGVLCYVIKTDGVEQVSAYKDIDGTWGFVRFQYRVLHSNGSNIAVFVIPMKQETERLRYQTSPPSREVGATGPRGYSASPHRVTFLPHERDGDSWQEAELGFDFSDLVASFARFALRINEGGEFPGPGHLLIGKVQIYTDVMSRQRR